MIVHSKTLTEKQKWTKSHKHAERVKQIDKSGIEIYIVRETRERNTQASNTDEGR